jgi:8-oxo-dGTP diphosphatase
MKPPDPGGFFHSAQMIDVVCGLILDSGGRVLACQRPAGKHLGGLWEFPGGKVEPGERPDLALARELEEELQIKVEVGDRLGEVVWDYGTVTVRLLPFFCQILAGNPVPTEHMGMRWCDRNAIFTLEWAPADLPVITEWLGLSDFRGKESISLRETAG